MHPRWLPGWGREDAGEDSSVGVLTPNLLFMLVVARTESTEKGHGVGLDKRMIPRKELKGRLEALSAEGCAGGLCGDV